MAYIIDKNSTGKTRKMLEDAKENNVTIVCKHPLHMQDKAHSYGIYGLKFVSYEELHQNDIHNEKIAVDELGDFFKHCYDVELDSFTMTVD